MVAGVVKAETKITETEVVPQFCRLEFRDNGAYKNDPTLRHAIAEFPNPAFNAITGLSGSPVYDMTSDVLCGMVVRGGLNGNRCQILYVDILDIMKMIEAVQSDKSSTEYTKTVAYKIA